MGQGETTDLPSALHWLENKVDSQGESEYRRVTYWN